MIELVLKNWNLGAIDRVEPIPSYWAKTSLLRLRNGGEFFLKEKSDLSIAERESRLLLRLAEQGAPVASPIPTEKGSFFVVHEDQVYCLYPKLAGETCSEHYDSDALGRSQMYGKAIGQLHKYLNALGHLPGFANLQLYKQIHEWAIPCLCRQTSILNAQEIESSWCAIEKESVPLQELLPKQLIHRDLHPANMLFKNGQVTGYLDFEMVVYGPRIFDLCYCATSLLVSAYPDEQKMQSWPALFHSLIKGYQEIDLLNSSEKKSIFATLEAIELLFAAFSFETGAAAAGECNLAVFQWLSQNRNRVEF